MSNASGKSVLIIATDGFEQSELEQPKRDLEAAGATVHIASPKTGSIKGWDGDDWGDSVSVDKALSDVSDDDYDALVLPGGQINPDKLRVETAALDLIKAFAGAGKPIAAICHAPWLLIEAGLVDGRRMTSFESIRTDLRNAGAQVVDDAVVVDGNFITSRKPEDLDAFGKAIIEALN